MIKTVAATMSRMAGNPVGGTKQFYGLDFAGRCLYYSRKNIGKQALIDAEAVRTEVEQIEMLRKNIKYGGNYNGMPKYDDYSYMSDEPDFKFNESVERVMREHVQNRGEGKPDTDEFNVCIAPYVDRLGDVYQNYLKEPSTANAQAVSDKLGEILLADLDVYEQNFKQTIIKSEKEMPSFMKVLNEVGKSKPLSTASKVGIGVTIDAIISKIKASNT